jgi:hypothetical protein
MNDTSKVSSISTRTDDDDMINPSLQPTTPVTIVQSTLSDLDILKYILSFVGWNQYRFVASFNHTFYDAYLHLFPRNKFTYYTASSIRQAMICYQESNASSNRWAQCVLCASAAQYGSLITLQYLRSSSFSDADDDGKEDDEEISCHWDSRTCAMAFYNGPGPIIVHGIVQPVPMRRNKVTLKSSNGHISTVVLGIVKRVKMRRRMDIWRFYNMRIHMVVHGISGPVPMLPSMVMYMYSNMLGRMAVHGTPRRL